MPDKARIAVIGTGWWATTAHLPSLQEDPDAEIVAVSDLRPEVLTKAAEHYGVAATYADHQEMLQQEEPEQPAQQQQEEEEEEEEEEEGEKRLTAAQARPRLPAVAHRRHGHAARVALDLLAVLLDLLRADERLLGHLLPPLDRQRPHLRCVAALLRAPHLLALLDNVRRLEQARRRCGDAQSLVDRQPRAEAWLLCILECRVPVLKVAT